MVVARKENTTKRAKSRPGVRVVKFGGELLEDAHRLRRLARRIRDISKSGPLIVVHGGGREVDTEMARVGIEKRTIDGLRITDEDTLDVVLGVLAGRVNTRLSAAIGAAGGSAVGLTGADGAISRVTAARRYRATDGTRVDLGFVGLPTPQPGPPRLLIDLLDGGHIPVIASIGSNGKGQLYNVNADTLAADVAVRIGAKRLTIAGTTRGVLDQRGRTIPVVDDGLLSELIADGQASAGMIAKLLACQAAVSGGVSEVCIVDGRVQSALGRIDAPGTTIVTARGTERRIAGS
jgi:acetylglutamate kinase